MGINSKKYSSSVIKKEMEQNNSKTRALLKTCYAKCHVYFVQYSKGMWNLCLKFPTVQKYKTYFDYIMYTKNAIVQSSVATKLAHGVKRVVQRPKHRLTIKPPSLIENTKNSENAEPTDGNANVVGVVKHVVMSGLSRKKPRAFNLLKLKKSTSLDNVNEMYSGAKN